MTNGCVAIGGKAKQVLPIAAPLGPTAPALRVQIAVVGCQLLQGGPVARMGPPVVVVEEIPQQQIGE